MWLGSTVELMAGAVPCNEEIVDLYICYWEGGAAPLQRALEEIRNEAWLDGWSTGGTTP